jgi:uncharacterized protein DUF6946
MSLFFNQQPISTVADALPLYRAKEFNSASRSTVPLLSLLAHSADQWPAIALACTPAHIARQVQLEFKVAPPHVKGTPSHTDVMLLTKTHAFAIEAKWTEPPYETVREWKGHTINGAMVLQAWLALLERHSAKRLDPQAFGDAVYQMVHRAASACASTRKPCLVYVQFCPLPQGRQPEVERLRADLTHLHSLLGAPPHFPFFLIEANITWSRAFDDLKVLPKGVPTTGDAVRLALRAGPLFDVTSVKVHRIRAHAQRAGGAEA